MLHSLLKGVTSTVKASLEESLVQILSPRRRIDILRDAMDAKKRGKPFSITFCGVNGVGKSTNLAKVKHGAHCEETCPISLSSGWKRLEIHLSTFHAKEKKQFGLRRDSNSQIATGRYYQQSYEALCRERGKF